MDIIAIENDGTKVRLVFQNGENFAYKNFPKGIIRVLGNTDDTLTIEHVNKLHSYNGNASRL